MNAKRRPPDFEKSLTELEGLVEKLERGDQPLEESLRIFERGVRLSADCQTALTEAQARVNILTQTPGGPELAPFDASDDVP